MKTQFLFKHWWFNRHIKSSAAMVAGLVALLANSAVGQPVVEATTSAAADPHVYLAEVCAELAKAWPTNRTVNIVCHGHSVPAGYFKTPQVRTFDAYPTLLHEQLCTRFSRAVINV